MPKHNAKFVNWSGKEINGWAVLGVDNKDVRRGKRRWLCKHLACGTVKSVLIYQLTGDVVRCAPCFKAKMGRALNSQLFKELRSGADDRGIVFELTKEYLMSLIVEQDYKCAITGVPIWIASSTEGHRTRRETTASVDRKNSSLGYVPGNVQWVHKTVNKFKWDMNESELLWWATLMVANNLEKISSLDVIPETVLFRKHSSAHKLSEEQIQQLRAEYLHGDASAEIAKRFKVSRVAVFYHTDDLREFVQEQRRNGLFAKTQIA